MSRHECLKTEVDHRHWETALSVPLWRCFQHQPCDRQTSALWPNIGLVTVKHPPCDGQTSALLRSNIHHVTVKQQPCDGQTSTMWRSNNSLVTVKQQPRDGQTTALLGETPCFGNELHQGLDQTKIYIVESSLSGIDIHTGTSGIAVFFFFCCCCCLFLLFVLKKKKKKEKDSKANLKKSVCIWLSLRPISNLTNNIQNKHTFVKDNAHITLQKTQNVT